MLTITNNTRGKYLWFWSNKDLTNIPLDTVLNVGYTYSDRYSEKARYLMSDDLKEIFDFSSVLTNTATIQPKDKLYFASSSLYPPTLLSKYKAASLLKKLDISRTLNANKADKIIINCKLPILNTRYYWIIPYKQRQIIQSVSDSDVKNLKNLQIQQKQLNNKFNVPVYLALKIVSNPEIVQLYVDYKNKLVLDSDLVKYVQGFLPTITKSEIDSMIASMNSSDKGIRDMGIQLFQYYNCSKSLLYIIKGLATLYGEYIPRASACSAAWNWLYCNLGLNPGDTFGDFKYNYRKYIECIKNNPINTMTLEDIKQEIKSTILERINSDQNIKELRDDLQMIGMEITICDTNRETDSSDREVESSEM